jgi:hypothetical protein
MNDNIDTYFKAIDEFLTHEYPASITELYIIGNVALTLAGIPDRGTKDIDVLKILSLSSPENEPLVNSLEENFGRNSTNNIKFGFYLDIIEPGITFIKPRPDYIMARSYNNLRIYRLSPLDTVVSKVISYTKSQGRRLNDLEDIRSALSLGIVKLQDVVSRCEEMFEQLEMDARFPEVILESIELLKSIAKEYGEVKFNYKLPDWLET